jgi:hypothetical protein
MGSRTSRTNRGDSMYLDTGTMIAIIIALLSLMGALVYSIYVIRLMDKTVAQMRTANAHLREQNRGR